MSEEKKNYVFIGGRMQGKTRDLINQLIEENKYLQQKVEQLENIRKEAIKWVKLMGKYENGSCTRNFKLMSADFNYLLNILNKGYYKNEIKGE